MIRLGLVGFPLSHSLSPKLHQAAFNELNLEGEYKLYPVPPEDKESLAEMAGLVRVGKLNGLNVTIPHKQAVIPFLDELTPSAKAIGAVNTLFVKNGILVGHNTDSPGFLADLGMFLTDRITEKIALVLGAGGAARAVVYALLTDGWSVTLAVRRADVDQAVLMIESFKQLSDAASLRFVLLEAEDLLQFESGITLIVNATPIGMAPEIEFTPWPVGLPFPLGTAIYDVIYNPRQTRLIQEARAAGLRATTGLGMLVEQAALSFACWTGKNISHDVMIAAAEG